MQRFQKRWLIAATLLALLLVSGWGALSLRYRFIPKRLKTVEPGFLYRSGQIDSRLIAPTLARLKIDVIVDLQGHHPSSPSARAAELEAARQLGIRYHAFSLEGDGTGSIEEYVKALAIVHQGQQEGKRVLVHCAAGTERTGALIGFYQLLFEKQPPEKVWADIQKAGHNPARNPRLRSFMNESLPILAKRLHGKGLLSKIPDPLPLLPSNSPKPTS